MKKTLLVILVIAAVAFSAFAGDFHYGIESTIDYDFNISETHPGKNEAAFAFKPYVYNDFFNLRLLAEWLPIDGARGFDYLMEFDTTDFYTILESSLKYIDDISITTDVVEFAVGKGTRSFEVNFQTAEYHRNRAQLKLNIGIAKVDLYATDFLDAPIYATAAFKDVRDSLQYANIKVNLGLVEVEAEATRQAYYIDTTQPEVFTEGKNRIIPKIGAKLQFGMADVGFYFTTDVAYNADDSAKFRLFDRWVLEALAQFKVGTFDLTGKFYLDNRLEGYSEMYFPNESLFGFRAEAKLDITDYVNLDIYGDLPLKLDGALRIVRDYKNDTMETIRASVEFGSWWKIGGSFQLKGLISHIEKKDDIMTIVRHAEPTITAGIYTVPLDITASVKLTYNTLYGDDFVPEVTVGAVIRADNFLSRIDK